VKKILEGVILILNILVAAGLLLSYLAPVVNPSRVFLPALLGLTYPYLLLFNLIFVCYWLIRLKKPILISLLVILLGWNHLNNLLPLNFRESEIPVNANKDQMFKVLAYNVREFNLYHWTRDIQAKENILNLVNQEDPDIICFQEYYTSQRKGETQREISEKLKSLPESAVYYISNPKYKVGIGIATFSRYPILKQSRIPFNTTYNAAMYTDIQLGTDTVRVFNVHLQSIRFREEDYAFMDTVRLKYPNQQMRGFKNIGSQLKKAFIMRAEQAEIISNYIKDSPYPVIVMGDFNDTSQSYTYRKIKKGLHDAFRVSGKGFGNTYSGELPSFRIDYILYSNPMVSHQFMRVKKDYSDHYPISTILYLPKEGATVE
jgi:endonuclease/exonuclease/phosphatase family metal-dependent hydrolase